jgi:hypothetical protein
MQNRAVSSRFMTELRCEKAQRNDTTLAERQGFSDRINFWRLA